MAYKDLHSAPFDESTIAKLEIFEDYAQAWIPTFVMRGVKELYIFDFFAGTGYDLKGVPGSPIRILSKLLDHSGHILNKHVKITLVLNEYEVEKFDLLKQSTQNFLEANKDLSRAVDIVYHNRNFEDLFPEILDKIKKYPSLVYLDQNGIKFFGDRYFLELEKITQTDFLYFLSSSYFWRFGSSEEFKSHVNIDMDKAKAQGYRFIHRSIIDQLKLKLPDRSKLKLYPFSLKKGVNIHGIVFGASHPRAVDKFLSIAWKRNEQNGEANFDIDEDAGKVQLDLFVGKKLNKIEKFQSTLRAKILSQELRSNEEVFNFTLDEGHIGKHAADCLRKMKKSGEVDFSGSSPLLTYENVHKNGKKIEYKTLKE